MERNALLARDWATEACRGDAVTLAEGGDEVREADEATDGWDILDAQIRSGDDLVGELEAAIHKPGVRSYVIVLTEAALEGWCRDEASFGQLVDSEVGGDAAHNRAEKAAFALLVVDMRARLSDVAIEIDDELLEASGVTRKMLDGIVPLFNQVHGLLLDLAPLPIVHNSTPALQYVTNSITLSGVFIYRTSIARRMLYFYIV